VIKAAIILNVVFIVLFVLTGLGMMLVGQRPLLDFLMSVVFVGILIGPAIRVLKRPTSKMLQIFVFLANASMLCFIVYVAYYFYINPGEKSGGVFVAAIYIAFFIPFILNVFISAKLLAGKMEV
jgi:hypothetical protein